MDTNIILPEDFYISYFYTGSSVICNPPVLHTDIDIMFLTDNMVDFEQELLEDNWNQCGFEEYDGTDESCWKAYRKDKLNYLFTDNKEYYDQFLAATLDAKEKNLLKKEDRIALFDTYLSKFKIDLTTKKKKSIIIPTYGSTNINIPHSLYDMSSYMDLQTYQRQLIDQVFGRLI